MEGATGMTGDRGQTGRAGAPGANVRQKHLHALIKKNSPQFCYCILQGVDGAKGGVGDIGNMGKKGENVRIQLTKEWLYDSISTAGS